MKNINRVLFLPLLAALTVGCASPTAFQSSEYDDVYYSSKDKTIIQDQQVAVQTGNNNELRTGDAAPNPEYSGKNSGTGNTYANSGSNDADYYSEDYAYTSRLGRVNTPYRGGLSYYDYGYNDFYWNNRSPFMYGRSAFYDPFFAMYDPFLFNPYVGFGYPRIYTGLSVVIGQPLYGGFYGAPYYGGGFYRGFNHFGNFNHFGGVNNYYVNNGWYRNDTNNAPRVQYGPRRERGVEPNGGNTANNGSRPRNSNGGVISGGGGGVVAPGVGGGGIARPADGGRSSRGRNTNDDMVTPRDNVNGVAAPGDNSDRRVTPADVAHPDDMPTRNTRSGRQSRGLENAGQVNESPQIERAPAGRDVETPSRRGRVEPGNYNFPDQPARVIESQPAVRPRSERNNEDYTPAPSRQQQRQEQRQMQEQPTRQERSRETYQAPRQERSYETPRQQERTYEAPRQQQRSYEAPSSRPSYTPAPSGGGGSSRSGRGRD